MTRYSYRAVNRAGKVIENSIECPSAETAGALLESRGLIPLSVEEQRAARALAGRRREPRVRLKPRDLALFSRQLATLLKAGSPLSSALHSVAAQAREEHRTLFLDIERDVRTGQSLSQALQRHAPFRGIFTATVAAAEQVGALETAFLQLAEMLEWEAHLRREVRSALQYPMTVIVVTAVAVIVLQQLVVPRFAAMFHQLGGELPLPTRILLGSTELISNWWWLLLISAVLAAFLVRRALSNPPVQLRLARWSLEIPLLGRILRQMYLARFARTLSLLQASGLPILAALEALQGTIGNRWIAHQVAGAREEVGRGERLADAIGRRPVFTPMVQNMIAIGEGSGRIDEALRTVSDYYEEETRRAIEDLTHWIEPLLTLFLAGFVLLLALAIFLPWWDMTNLYRN